MDFRATQPLARIFQAEILLWRPDYYYYYYYYYLVIVIVIVTVIVIVIVIVRAELRTAQGASRVRYRTVGREGAQLRACYVMLYCSIV